MRSWSKIMKGFPEVPGMPSKPRTRGSVERHGWQYYVYKAVHGNDPVHREYLIEVVARRLSSGAPLPEPAREWLLFVLGTLQRRHAVPHLAVGRPIDHGATVRLYSDLFAFLRANSDKPKSRRLPISEALNRAAEKLSKSQSTIRKLYYSAGYKSWRETLRAERRK
jgi:hypothetical protein